MSVAAANQPDPAAETPFFQIDTALLSGATVLTPNQRTARHLLLLYDRARQAAGLLTWQAPAILSWGAWTASLWRGAVVSGRESRVLLNTLQERELWRRIVDSDRAETLRPAASQAKLCQAAANLLGTYDVAGRFARESYPLHAMTADAERFAGWYARFEEQCRSEALLPASHLAIGLAEHLRHGRIAPAGEFLLYGFNAPQSAHRLLVGALEQAGTTVRHIAATVPRQSPAKLLRCSSGASEMGQCAHWVRQQLEGHPAASIAVIVPDLQATRNELERELRRTVAPHISDVTAGEQSPVYEFSSGRPLDCLPLVQDALRLLRWCAGPLSLEDAGALLRSPYLRLSSSPLRGAELDMHTVRGLRALRAEVFIRDVIAELKSEDGDTLQHLGALGSAARALQRERSGYAAFADAARDVLRTVQWPGPDALDSEERQALDRWEDLLDRVASLDLLGNRTTFDAFVAAVSSAAKDTVFARENTGAPVQVMTVSEAEGSTADALWFLHANENTWPARQALHPLLPWTLQRELHMPGASTLADEEAARGTLQSLLNSAGGTVLSYSSTTTDGAQRPSPLVVEITEIAPADAYAFNDETPTLTEQHLDDERLPDLPNMVIRGGASVLTAQAQCGFRAFAEKRLFATPVDPRDAGFTPMERGTQVHDVLQRFWEIVRTQSELVRLGKTFTDFGFSERDALLRRLIDESALGEGQAPWDAAYIEVQRKRLFKLLTAWLDFEKERPSFIVEHTELKVADAELGPLHLELRVDRVDRVDAGTSEGTILIDYKTGKAAAREWQGERPDAPQLPVYAIAGGLGKVAGLAFGLVKVGRDGMKFEGRAVEPGLLRISQKGGGKEPFETQLENWQRDLQKLAEAYAAGDASVDPKDYPKTCDHCGQRMLCRVDAAVLLELDDLQDDEDEGGMPWA